MHIKDLSIDEFTQLFKGLIRETIEEILQEMLDDPEVNLPLKQGVREDLLRQRDRRRSGQSVALTTEQVMARLGID